MYCNGLTAFGMETNILLFGMIKKQKKHENEIGQLSTEISIQKINMTHNELNMKNKPRNMKKMSNEFHHTRQSIQLTMSP